MVGTTGSGVYVLSDDGLTIGINSLPITAHFLTTIFWTSLSTTVTERHLSQFKRDRFIPR